MPDDDEMLGQNEVDVRNEARRERREIHDAFFNCKDPESDWIDEQSARARLREAIRVVEEGDENWQTVGDMIDAAKAVLDD